MFCPNCGTENIAGARFCRNCGNALVSETPSPFGETAVVAPEYMGFWIRLVAYLIDSVVVWIAFVVLILIASPLGDTAMVIAYLIGVVGTWLYFAYMESSERQATLGKLAMGMKVTGMNGERVSFGKATGRFFGKIVSGLILYIGYLMIAWDARKQGLHDKMAGTLVVKKA